MSPDFVIHKLPGEVGEAKQHTLSWIMWVVGYNNTANQATAKLLTFSKGDRLEYCSFSARPLVKTKRKDADLLEPEQPLNSCLFQQYIQWNTL